MLLPLDRLLLADEVFEDVEFADGAGGAGQEPGPDTARVEPVSARQFLHLRHSIIV